MVVPTPKLFDLSIDVYHKSYLWVVVGMFLDLDAAATFYWRAILHRCMVDPDVTVFYL
jgi:hypothetical protein